MLAEPKPTSNPVLLRVMPPSPDGGIFVVRRDRIGGEAALATSFTPAMGWFVPPAFRPGVVGTAATLGVVAAGAAIFEAALIPGLLIGGAAVLAPRLLPRDMLRGLRGRRGAALSPTAAAATKHSVEAPVSGAPAPFDAWRAAVKTITYRVMVTTVDFGANYFVIGELATAAGLSSVSLVAGPIAYFAHEAAWHYYGPVSARHADPLDATVNVSFPGAAASGGSSPRLKVSRAVAKTATYEVVTGVSEFSVNYLFVRDLAAAAGLTAFSLVVSPFVYYVHEKAWELYDATKVQPATRVAG
jgi:uncharacterized membrane protein